MGYAIAHHCLDKGTELPEEERAAASAPTRGLRALHTLVPLRGSHPAPFPSRMEKESHVGIIHCLQPADRPWGSGRINGQAGSRYFYSHPYLSWLKRPEFSTPHCLCIARDWPHQEHEKQASIPSGRCLKYSQEKFSVEFSPCRLKATETICEFLTNSPNYHPSAKIMQQRCRRGCNVIF